MSSASIREGETITLSGGESVRVLGVQYDPAGQDEDLAATLVVDGR